MSYIKNLREKIGNDAINATGVGVIIYKDGKVLLQKRTDFDLWGIHGGSLDLGQTIEETMKRELMEEINIIPTKYTLYGIYSGDKMHIRYPNNDEVYYTNVILFCEEYEGILKPDYDEVKGLEWFDKDELPDNIVTIDKVILKDINEFITNRKVMVK